MEHGFIWFEDTFISVDEPVKTHTKKWMKLFRNGCDQAKDSSTALLNFVETRIP